MLYRWKSNKIQTTSNRQQPSSLLFFWDAPYVDRCWKEPPTTMTPSSHTLKLSSPKQKKLNFPIHLSPQLSTHIDSPGHLDVWHTNVRIAALVPWWPCPPADSLGRWTSASGSVGPAHVGRPTAPCRPPRGRPGQRPGPNGPRAPGSRVTWLGNKGHARINLWIRRQLSQSVGNVVIIMWWSWSLATFG